MCVLYRTGDHGGETLKIFFSKNLSDLEFDLGNTLCVYHRQYKPCLPHIKNCNYIEFSELETQYKTYSFDGYDAIVFIGANKFFTPSSRIHPVFEYIPYSLPERIQLVSVDRAPYVGELWRIWAHFYLTKTEFGGYTYSYLLETHYNQFREGLRLDSPLSTDKIREYSKGVVAIDYRHYFKLPHISVIQVDPDTHREYQELKARLFEQYDHVSKIIRGLSKFAQEACPDRRIPQLHKCFDTPDNISIVRTDLMVDEFLTNRILEKIREVNSVCEALYTQQEANR